MTVQYIAEQALWIAVVCALLLISPTLPAPWGYAAAIAATVLGPGHAVPESVFPAGYLSTPERWLFTVLAGLAVVVLATFVLLKAGVQLDRTVVVMTVLGLTVASSIVGVATRWRRPPANGQSAPLYARRQRLVFFSGGVVIGTLVAGLVWRIAGI